MKRTTKGAVIATVGMAIALCGPTAWADRPVEPTPIGRVVSTLNPMNWRMPKMPRFSSILPAKEEKVRIKKKKDSLVDEVSQTASRSWQRTKETLNPKKLNPVRFMPASAKKPSNPKRKGPGFFESMFGPPPPRQATTVNDFLGQDKPRG